MNGQGGNWENYRGIVGCTLMWGSFLLGWILSHFCGTDAGVLVGGLTLFVGFGVATCEGGPLGTLGALLAVLSLYISLPVIAMKAGWVVGGESLWSHSSETQLRSVNDDIDRGRPF